MTWFKVDDKLFESTKIRGAGVFGRALWLAAGVKCASSNTDGLVEQLVAQDAGYLAEVPDWTEAAASLVRVGLWHDHRTIRRCEPCMEATNGKGVPAGCFYFHKWHEWQLSKQSQSSDEAKRKDARRRALYRNKALIEAIRDRDGTLCRYCAKRVDFDDRRSDDGGTYDHVDPDGQNTLGNVVVACRGCNNAKHNNTPDEAGMPLLAPGTYLVPIQNGSDPDLDRDAGELDHGSDPNQIGTSSDTSESGSDLPSRAPHARLGTGPDRNQFGSGSDLIRGSDRAGSVEAGDGVGSGPGQASFGGNPEEASA